MRNEAITRQEAITLIDQKIGEKGIGPNGNFVRAALTNRALLVGNPAVHTPSAATITAVAGILLTAKGSGLFEVDYNFQYAVAAADVVTVTLTTYQNSVAGTNMTLPANATATGLNCYVDSTGAGIAPTAGATVGAVITAPSWTTPTGASNYMVDIEQIVGGTITSNVPVGVPVGQQFYCTISVTNTVAARAISQLAIGAFELPA